MNAAASGYLSIIQGVPEPTFTRLLVAEKNDNCFKVAAVNTPSFVFPELWNKWQMAVALLHKTQSAKFIKPVMENKSIIKEIRTELKNKISHNNTFRHKI